MSALHEAARRVVAAWVSTRPAWVQECNEAVLALDAALKAQAGCDTETDCTSQPWCRISGECHRKQKQPEPAQEPVAWVECDGELVWNNREAAIGRNLYTAPPPRPPLTDEEIDALPWSGSPRQFARAAIAKAEENT